MTDMTTTLARWGGLSRSVAWPQDLRATAERYDRMARLVLLPMLALATVLAWLGPTAGDRMWPGGPDAVGWAALAATAVWSALLLRHPVRGVPRRRRAAVCAVHVLLCGLLVWGNPWYGAFAFTAYFFADELDVRERSIGFVLAAGVLAASQSDGYPTAWSGHLLLYTLMLVFDLTAVIVLGHLMNRVIQQNEERGRMIAELGQVNRRLEASMAENAGLHAQLVVQAREAGALDERHRLAGEIHDTLAQGLVGIIAQLEAARQAGADPAERERHLALADSLARANLTEARRSVRAMRPGQLERAGLPEAVADLARSWSEHTEIAVRVETTGAPARAAEEIETALFRVAQESLNNVAKHARATTVHVTLSYLDGEVLLDVADDGTGFDTGEHSDGYGLGGMRRRLDLLDGRLTVESEPGLGTTVNASVPLHRPAREAA